MTRPLYAPCIIQLDSKGRVLFAQPLEPVALPLPGLRKWNARIPAWRRSQR